MNLNEIVAWLGEIQLIVSSVINLAFELTTILIIIAFSSSEFVAIIQNYPDYLT